MAVESCLLRPVLVIAAFLALANTAPVKENAIDKRRESTKETIELEDTLKQLAGEDKKYFSNSIPMPMPQIDGLEGSGDLKAELKPLSNQINAKLNPLEEQIHNEEEEEQQLRELPELSAPVKIPVPGPYGPGLETQHGVSLEYEPSNHGKPQPEQEEEQAEDEGEEEEDYFLERVMETLRRHPELLSELMQDERSQVGDISEVEMKANNEAPQKIMKSGDENDLTRLADYDDRVEEIQAELAAIRSQEDPHYRLAGEMNKEQKQEYTGDHESHVVSKKHSIIPKEFVKDDIDTLNHYFDKYSSEEANNQVDIPIM